MILSGHQPTFLPWGGYVAKYAACDEWVEMDSAQFERGSFQNRNYVRTRDGRAVLLTVPVEHNGKPVATRDLKIAPGSRWRRKHIETLRQCYGKTPGWEEWGGSVIRVYENAPEFFMDMASVLEAALLEALGIIVPVSCPPGHALRSDWTYQSTDFCGRSLLELCSSWNVDGFIFGEHGPDYVNAEEWKAAGVEPIFTTYQNPDWLTAVTPQGKIVPVTAWDAVFRFGAERLSEITGGLSVRDSNQASLVRLRAS